VWFAWKPAKTGGAYADVCAAANKHRVRAWRLVPGKPVDFDNLVAANEGDAFVPGVTPCRDRWIAKAGEQYYLQVGGHGNSTLGRHQDDVAPGKPTWKSAPPTLTGPSRTWTWGVPADEDLAGFDCAVDGKPVTPCEAAGTTIAGLTDGLHQLQIKSRDTFGNRSAPLTTSWVVDATGPETTGPGLWFSSPEVTATFQCSVDGGAWYGCVSPLGVTVAPGLHEVRIRAVDKFGNADPTPLTVTVGEALPVPAPPVTVQPVPAPLPPAAKCGVALTAPKALTRAALRRGVTLRLASTRNCTATLELRQGRTSLAKVSRTVTAHRPTTAKLRTTKARRGKVTLRITDGAGTRTIGVKVK
jgi:hypothetical protein